MIRKLLTSEEEGLVIQFLEDGIETQMLNELTKEKRSELRNCFDQKVPKTGITYQTFLEKNNITCPIEVFLNNLTSLLEDENIVDIIMKRKYHAFDDPRFHLLEDLKRELPICGGRPGPDPCPCCPALRDF